MTDFQIKLAYALALWVVGSGFWLVIARLEEISTILHAILRKQS